MDTWTPPDLSGLIALVTGASKGVGRGIALVLGQARATVYMTGRTTKSTSPADPRTIEAAAEAVNAAGGTGIAIPCDHRDEDRVRAVFATIQREHGRLDLLVNNLVGWGDVPMKWPLPAIWESPLAWWDANFIAGVRAHYHATCLALPLMVPYRRGLIICTSECEGNGDPVLDMRAAATVKLSDRFAQETRQYGVAILTLYPGFTRTEAVGDPDLQPDLEKRAQFLAETQSIEYTGRAVAELAADQNSILGSGMRLSVGDVATIYNFTDIDGRRPETWPNFRPEALAARWRPSATPPALPDA